MAGKRKALSVDVRRLVLHEAGYKCANPACRTIITLDIHHMEHVAEGGGDEAENLLPLCPNCHALHHKRDIPRESIRAWKMLLLSLNEGFDRRSIDILLALDRLQKVLKVSGDAIVRCASLIASELVYVHDRMYIDPSKNYLEGGLAFQSDYEITISRKGMRFVEAWKAGDQRAAIAAMRSEIAAEAEPTADE